MYKVLFYSGVMVCIFSSSHVAKMETSPVPIGMIRAVILCPAFVTAWAEGWRWSSHKAFRSSSVTCPIYEFSIRVFMFSPIYVRRAASGSLIFSTSIPVTEMKLSIWATVPSMISCVSDVLKTPRTRFCTRPDNLLRARERQVCPS